MIHTILVEDDPMVAQINRQYLLQLGEFQIDGIFDNGGDALSHIHQHQTDLAVLDVYMPRMNGVELLRRLRCEGIPIAVIMVTAATEVQLVEEVLRLGAVDYLIKPYSFERFRDAVQKYLAKEDLLRSRPVIDQKTVDKLLGQNPEPPEEELRKGLNQKTLSTICALMGEQDGKSCTCESLSAASGLSKVTVRRYLNYLIETDRIRSSLDYETGGRPRVLYSLK